MTIQVTLVIDPALVGEGCTTAMVAARLAELGGPIVSWQSDADGGAARAEFKFKNLARRDTFVADAFAIPGVTLRM